MVLWPDRVRAEEERESVISSFLDMLLCALALSHLQDAYLEPRFNRAFDMQSVRLDSFRHF